MRIWSSKLTIGSILVAAWLCGTSASAAVVAAADVVPEATFQWGTNGPDKWGQVGLSSSGTVNVTADFPRDGNGSMRLDLPNTFSKSGLAFYPTKTFGKLAEITKASYQWLVHSTDVVDQAPVLRLYLRNAQGLHTQTLVYTPDIAGEHGIGLDKWTTSDMVNGIVWQGRSAAQGGIEPNVARSFKAFQSDPRFADMVVFAVEGGAGNGSSGFVGAIDNIEVVGSLASVSANFEIVPPAASIACDKTTLFDSDGQTSTCTVTLSRPAQAATIINVQSTGDATRYSGCAAPLTIAAGASTATCVVTATPNTTKSDGNVTASIALALPGNADDYILQSGATVATIQIQNDDGDVVVPVVVAPPAPVPALGGWALMLLSAMLAGCAALWTRRGRVSKLPL